MGRFRRQDAVNSPAFPVGPSASEMAILKNLNTDPTMEEGIIDVSAVSSSVLCRGPKVDVPVNLSSVSVPPADVFRPTSLSSE